MARDDHTRDGTPSLENSVLWLSPIEPPSRVVNHLRGRGLRLVLQEETQVLPPARLAPLPRDAAVLRKLTLTGRRVAILHPDPGNADAQAQSLRSRGAEVIALGLDPTVLDRVETFDADAVVIEAVDFYAGCWEIVRALWRHPRLRWAPVILATPDPLALANLTSPNVNLVCAAVQSLSIDSDEIVARVRSRETFEIALERIGPARTLRALLDPGLSLRARFEAGAVTVEVDVAERIIVGARGGHGSSVDDSLLGPEALAALMNCGCGRVMIQPVASPAVTNLMAPLDTALHAARESLRAPARVTASVGSRASSNCTTVVSFMRPPKEVIAESAMSASTRAAQSAHTAKALMVPPPSVSLVRRTPGRSHDERSSQPTRDESSSQPTRRQGKACAVSPQVAHTERAALVEDDAHGKNQDAERDLHPARNRPDSPTEEAGAQVFPHTRTLVGVPPAAALLASGAPLANPQHGADTPREDPVIRVVSETAWLPAEHGTSADERDLSSADALEDEITASGLATTFVSGVAWRNRRQGLLVFAAVPIACAAMFLSWSATNQVNNVGAAAKGSLTGTKLGMSAAAPILARQDGPLEQRPLANVPIGDEQSADTEREGAKDTESNLLERRARARQASKLVGQGHSFRRKGLLGAARARYLKALEALDGYPRALAGLTQVALAKREGLEALRYARSLVRVRPNEANNHLLLGDAYELAGDNAKAREEWRVASGLGSRTARIRLK